MNLGFLVKDVFILVSIASLLLLGLGITLNSGSGTVAVVGSQQCRKVWGNLFHTVLALAACLMTLVMVQQLVGFRLTTFW